MEGRWLQLAVKSPPVAVSLDLVGVRTVKSIDKRASSATVLCNRLPGA